MDCWESLAWRPVTELLERQVFQTQALLLRITMSLMPLFFMELMLLPQVSCTIQLKVPYFNFETNSHMGFFHFPKFHSFSKSLALFSSVLIFHFFLVKKLYFLRLTSWTWFSFVLDNFIHLWHGFTLFWYSIGRNQEASAFDFGELEEAIARQVRNDEAQARMLLLLLLNPSHHFSAISDVWQNQLFEKKHFEYVYLGVTVMILKSRDTQGGLNGVRIHKHRKLVLLYSLAWWFYLLTP